MTNGWLKAQDLIDTHARWLVLISSAVRPTHPRRTRQPIGRKTLKPHSLRNDHPITFQLGSEINGPPRIPQPRQSRPRPTLIATFVRYQKRHIRSTLQVSKK